MVEKTDGNPDSSTNSDASSDGSSKNEDTPGTGDVLPLAALPVALIAFVAAGALMIFRRKVK
mgnify:FL=1